VHTAEKRNVNTFEISKTWRKEHFGNDYEVVKSLGGEYYS
jgi:hypothetical protein